MLVECSPTSGVAKVFIEAGEETLVHWGFAALLTVPETVWGGFGDGVVDPSWWDVVVEFVVEDFLKWRDDLVRLALNITAIDALKERYESETRSGTLIAA